MKLSTTVVDSLVFIVPVGMLNLTVLRSLMHSGSAAVGCRSRWFLLLRSEPKAVAPHGDSLTSSSMEPPLAVIWYFGLYFVVSLLSLHGRSWNLPLYNFAPCLCWSCLVCCCPCCHSPAMPGGPSTHSPDLTKLQTSAAWWGGVLFWFVSKLYAAYNVTFSSAVFPMHLYPRMMQNSDPLIVSLLPDF